MPIALRSMSFAAIVLGAGVWEPRLGDEHAVLAPLAPVAVSVPVALVAPQGCGDEKKGSTHISDNDSGERRTTVRWSSRDCEIELGARGKFAVKGDLSDFESLSRGGWVKLSEERGSTERVMQLRDEDGRMTRTYKVNGDDRPWDADAQRWLAGVLVELERRTAFAAEQRVPMLLAAGGPGAVIDEVARMRGDYASHVYFTTMFKRVDRLDAPLVRRALTVAGERVASDYYRTEVLRALEKRGLPDDESRLAYLTASGTIGSDYYRAEALGALLDEGDRLSRPVGDALLKAAVGIGSDYYASETLKRAARRGLVRPENRESFFRAVRAVSSDHYRSEILLGLLKGDSLDKVLVGDVVAATDGMSSDHYVSEVLLAAANRYAMDGDTRAAYVKAANGIKSDHYHRRAMSALVKQTMLQ